LKKNYVVENSIITDIVPTAWFTVKVFFLTITVNTYKHGVIHIMHNLFQLLYSMLWRYIKNHSML
jgi:hypothetical protein